MRDRALAGVSDVQDLSWESTLISKTPNFEPLILTRFGWSSLDSWIKSCAIRLRATLRTEASIVCGYPTVMVGISRIAGAHSRVARRGNRPQVKFVYICVDINVAGSGQELPILITCLIRRDNQTWN